MTHVNSKHATQTIRIASWNVRSLVKEKVRQLATTAGAMSLDIIIIQELRRDATHGERISGPYSLWCTNHSGTNNHGVGFLVHDRITVLDFAIHTVANSTARAAQLTIETKRGRRSLYALYAPHAGYGEEIVQQFWEDAIALPDIAKSVVGVDANAHVHPLNWTYPPSQPTPNIDIRGTNSCGLHLLAFANTLDLRPANMMPTAHWSERTTFIGNQKGQAGVIDFLMIPSNKSNEFKDGATVQQTDNSALTSDHKMLLATWNIKVHHAQAPQRARPKMGPENTDDDQDISPSDDLYRELFNGVRTLHPNENPTNDNHTHIPTHHVRYRNWIPAMTHIENLQSLIASLKRSKAHNDTINDARKRLREAWLERRTKTRKINWGTLVDAFKQNNAKAAFGMLKQGKPRPPRKRFTRQDHTKERKRYRDIYANPPQQPPISPATEDKTTYFDAAEITVEQTTAFSAFNPHATNATFVDGSYTPAIDAKKATETTEAIEPCAAKCGWAAFDTITKTVVFGAADIDAEHSVNHGETLAILGAQTAFTPSIIATDSTHVINTAANLACEAIDDMQHIPNTKTWREIWRQHGIYPCLLAKVKAHSGIIAHEITDVFASIGASLPHGLSKKCTLDDAMIKRIATNDAAHNEITKKARRLTAATFKQEAHPALTFSPTPNAPRRAADHIPHESEIKQELSELNTESAAGPDGIRTRDLSHPAILPILVRLIQEIWRSGKIPSHWLKSYLIGIPKAHDTVTRGIALTATCLKVLTSIIRRRAAGFALLSCQWGFRTHRGTAQATTLLREMLNRRSTAGLPTTVIAIDLKKAFDSVRRDEIDKLLIEYGYGTTAANLVKQMYNGDVLYLFLNNENLSEPIAPEKGVKQGCLLSSGIFNLFIDRALRVMIKTYPNITGNSPSLGPIVLAYADDMAIAAINDEDAAKFLQKFAIVLESYGLKINEDKTKVLRALARTHETTQTTTTYKRRTATQEKWAGAWARPSALLDGSGAFAGPRTLQATLYMPNGNETNLSCSHCEYIAMNDVKCSVQDLMWIHAKREHLTPTSKLKRHCTLYGPGTLPSVNTHKLVRPTMTNAQVRTARPLFLPPLKCGPFTFEAVEEIIYLGSTVHQHGNLNTEMNKRIAAACAAYGTLRKQVGNESTSTKAWLYDVYATTRLLFATETWAQTLAQTSRLNSIRMKHLRTLTNNWYTKHLNDFGCPNHPHPSPIPTQDPKCTDCQKLGTRCFYDLRHFIVHLNTKRNARILAHTYYLYNIMRKRQHTGKAAERIIFTISSFLGPPPGAHGNVQPTDAPFTTTPPSHPGQPFNYHRPYWGHELLPLRTNAAIRSKWKLRTTSVIIEQRRANLLGNLIRHKSAPANDIAQNRRADWWKSCITTTAKMKISLEDAHDISFWKKSTKALHTQKNA